MNDNWFDGLCEVMHVPISGADPGFPAGGRGPVLGGGAWTSDVGVFW